MQGRSYRSGWCGFHRTTFQGTENLIKPRRAMSRGISHALSWLRAHVLRLRHGAAHTIVPAMLLKNRIRDDFRRPEIQNFPGSCMHTLNLTEPLQISWEPLQISWLRPCYEIWKHAQLCITMCRLSCVQYTAKTEGLKQPRLGYFSCSHKFC